MSIQKTIRHLGNVLKQDNLRYVVIVLIGYVLNYGLHTLLARYLPPHEYGDFSVMLTTLGIIVLIIQFGTGGTILKNLSASLAIKDYAATKSYIFWHSKLITILSIISVIVGFALMVLLFILDTFKYTQLDYLHPITLVFFLAPAAVFLNLCNAILLAKKRTFASLIPDKIFRNILIIFVLGIFIAIGAQIGAHDALLAFAVSLILLLIFQLYKLKDFYASVIKTNSRVTIDNKWRSQSVKFFFVTILNASSYIAGMLLLELFGNDEADVGIYAAIYIIFSLMGLFVMVLDKMKYPTIVALYQKKNSQAIQALINRLLVFKILLCMPIYIIIIVFGKNLLGLFNPLFVNGYLALIIMVSAYFFTLFDFMSKGVLSYCNEQTLNTRIRAIEVAYSIIVTAVLVYNYQLSGLAIAFASKLLLFSIVRLYFVRKHLGLKCCYVF